MKYWPLTLHLEVHFDSVGCEPAPWWRPFLWVRHPWEKLRDECLRMSDGLILRCGVLGFHFCAAVHWYGDFETPTRQRVTVTHAETCPVAALDFEVGEAMECNCDFGRRLAAELDIPYTGSNTHE